MKLKDRNFRFNILADFNHETKVDKGLEYFRGIQKYFELKYYGEDLKGIVLVMMCRSPHLEFKRRKRFSKKNRFFYLDIMLDYQQMIDSKDDLTRAMVVLNQINLELFPSLVKYKFKNLDLAEMQKDLESFVKLKFQ